MKTALVYLYFVLFMSPEKKISGDIMFSPPSVRTSVRPYVRGHPLLGHGWANTADILHKVVSRGRLYARKFFFKSDKNYCVGGHFYFF